jgi:hypothetical protein
MSQDDGNWICSDCAAEKAAKVEQPPVPDPATKHVVHEVEMTEETPVIVKRVHRIIDEPVKRTPIKRLIVAEVGNAVSKARGRLYAKQ